MVEGKENGEEFILENLLQVYIFWNGNCRWARRKFLKIECRVNI